MQGCTQGGEEGPIGREGQDQYIGARTSIIEAVRHYRASTMEPGINKSTEKSLNPGFSCFSMK